MNTDSAASLGPERTLAIRFVGSGSEYFRIWVVNLLLIVLTLGLYYPFAKVRRLRYFHAACEVDGAPLTFHANPWAMLRGYLLVGTLFVVYSVAGQFSTTAGMVALAIIGAVWPALWRSSLRFRLANTSWRGLRFGFEGSLADAYRVMLAGWALVWFFVLATLLAQPTEDALAPQAGGGWLLLVVAVMLAAFPAFLWQMRRYQHGHLRLGSERSRFDAGAGGFYKVFALAALIFLGAMLALALAAAAVLFMTGAINGQRPAGRLPPAAMLPLGLLLVLFYVVVLAAISAFVSARLQNLVWNPTRTQHLRIDSRLAVGALLKLNLLNGLLVVFTLGLYLPFAAVATVRLRLEALSLHSTVAPETLVAAATPADESAAGDAAGDVFGIDIGL